MGRYKCPKIVATGVCLNGDTPPEQRSREEQIKFMTEISIIAAKALGAKPISQKSKEAVPKN